MDEERKAQGSDGNTESDESDGKRKQRRIIFIAVIAVLLAVIGILVYLLLKSEPETVVVRDPFVPLGGRGTVLTPENIDEVREQFSGPLEDGQYTVSMTTNWVFENGTREPSRNALVNNLQVNTRTVCFDVYVDGEVVYCSPYIPLGGTLSGFALDQNLAPGVYDAVIVYFLMDDNYASPDDYQVITSLSVAMTITVN